MFMPDSYKIDILGDICIRKFFGEIHLDTIQYSWFEVLALNSPDMYKGFLTDFSSAKVIITKYDLDDILLFYKSKEDYLFFKKNAVISLQPSLIAFTTLLKMDLKRIDIRYYLKPFSTYNAAFYWLLK